MPTTPDATEKRPPVLGPYFTRTIDYRDRPNVNYRDHSHMASFPVIALKITVRTHPLSVLELKRFARIRPPATVTCISNCVRTVQRSLQ
jgi:hypothetical protein